MIQARKPGRRKTDLSDESSQKVLKTSKSLVRTDWGGQDPDKQIQKRAAEAGLDLGPKTREFVKALCEEQVESCRRRAFPRIDEVIRRLEGSGPPFEESSP
jgi:hypothetical protein